jgi:ribonucleoside-diphosphate reductase alpha chain
MEVMRMHRDASYEISEEGVPADLLYESRKAWDNVVTHGDQYGLRNAQISVLAPTGTISFLMDCDTTGIEPDLALVKYKWLVGGGMIKIVNQTVPDALKQLGYTSSQSTEILEYIEKQDTIEGAPHIKEEDLSVFDCAFKPANGERSIHYMGHIRMMSAVQPFISGAISKTVNVPHEATEADITDAYMQAWKMGVKAIAIYRDGSKRQQAMTTSREKDAKLAHTNRDKDLPKEEPSEKTTELIPRMTDEIRKPRRRRLPDERRSITHKFAVGNHEGYITVGLYDDGQPGELFVTMAKEGSVISGLMDSFATAISIGLQYGVPLPVLVNKFVHMRFEPSGYTNNPNIRIAKSIVDYVFRWMGLKFLSREQQLSIGIQVDEENPEAIDVQVMLGNVEKTKEIPITPVSELQENLFTEKEETPQEVSREILSVPVQEVAQSHTSTFDNQSDAPACDTCGSMMVRNASCYKCLNCGATSGCS